MLGSGSVSQLAKLTGVALLVCMVWYLGFSNPDGAEVSRLSRAEKDLFVADFLEHEIDGKFDGAAIDNLCTARKWTPGLLMSCEAARGGIASVRNAYLHCIRFAIEAGAELVLPDIVPRSEDDLQDIGSRVPVPLDYYFDNDHLHQILGTFCPQMKLYSTLNELYNIPQVAGSIDFIIPDVNGDWVNGSVLANPKHWQRQFRKFLDARSPPETREYPMRVHLKHTQWVWPTAYDTAAVATSFGRILRIRPDARRLAASALFTLSRRFDLNLDPRTRYHPQSFVGVHLRTEQDVSEGLPDYTTQAADYFHFLSESKSSVAFVGSGASKANITAFTKRAADFNVTIATKRDILDAGELSLLDGLTWDQRGLVDYEIMLRAGLVAGVGVSSFDWNLALRRSYAFGEGPVEVPHPLGEMIAWKDQFTTLYGKFEDRQEAMKLTIWP